MPNNDAQVVGHPGANPDPSKMEAGAARMKCIQQLMRAVFEALCADLITLPDGIRPAPPECARGRSFAIKLALTVSQSGFLECRN